MASTDALPVPRKNVAYRVYAPLYDADGDPVSGPAGLDSEVSKDGGSFADCTNEWTEIGSSGVGYLDLTSTEMNADAVVVRVQSSTTGAKTTVLVFYPQESGDIKVDVQSVAGTAQTGRDLGASVLLSSGTGTGQVSLSSGAVLLQATQSGVTIPTVTTLTNAPSDSSGVTTLLSRIPSGLFSGITSLAQWLGLLAGKQTGNSTARTEVRATGAGSGTYDETTDSQEALRDNVGTNGAALALAKTTNITGFNDISAAQVNAEADTALSDVGLTTTITGRIDAAVSTRATPAQVNTEADTAIADAGLATAANLATVAGYVDTEVAAIKAKTDTLPASPAATGDIPSAASVASAVRTNLTTELGRIDAAVTSRSAFNGAAVLADSVPSDGTRPTAEQALYAIYQFLTERAVSGTTLTVRKPDGSTSLMTFTLNDADAPTSITRAT